MTDLAPQPASQIFTSRQFTSWLGEAAASLVLTTYQSGKVLFIGCSQETGKLSILERTIERPMGLGMDGRKLAVASLYQAHTFLDALSPGETAKGSDAVYVPQISHFTGDLDAHDMAYDGDGRLVLPPRADRDWLPARRNPPRHFNGRECLVTALMNAFNRRGRSPRRDGSIRLRRRSRSPRRCERVSHR